MNAASEQDLRTFLADSRTRVDQELDRRVGPGSARPAALHEPMRHALLAPGKRLRAAVLIACNDLFRGADPRAALSLACAVEMVHAASLILDDLPSMDDATLRRGLPATHRVHGEANAILAAVALLNLGFETIQTEERLRARERTAATTCLADSIGARGLIGGQVADLEATGRVQDLEDLEYVHSHKTGALFIAAARLGAIAAGARARESESLARYAKNLGLAFQITDDLLDVEGDPETTGKDAGMDRDKTTFVDLCGVAGARRLVDELIRASTEALGSFGKRGRLLVALAELVRTRDR